jgi:hypothetical protein
MNKKLFVFSTVLAVLVLTVVGCAVTNDSRPVPLDHQLYPAVYVEIVGKGYYNPNCGDLQIDYRADCDPEVPRRGRGKVSSYPSMEDDSFSGKWVIQGKYRVCVEEFDMNRNILPGCGWYKPESLRLTDWRPTPWPTSTLIPTPTPTPNPCIYVVQSGDTLISIAGKYDTTVDFLLKKNGIRNANWIYAGQTLNVCK